MSTKDNGAIDYRRRVRERRNTQVATKPAVPVLTDPYDPPIEPGAVIEAAAVPVVVVVPPPVAAPTKLAEVDAITSRTPQAVREQAKSAVVQLLGVSDAEYTAMMTELSVADPILYAAVVDEINNARAAETKTA